MWGTESLAEGARLIAEVSLALAHRGLLVEGNRLAGGTVHAFERY